MSAWFHPRHWSGLVFFAFLAASFHFIYVMTIFDIYFKSPVVHGMTPQQNRIASPSKRLITMVADGLRADKFLLHPENVPFLRSVAENRGRWGVSHTRVPTETRPCMVALFGGFYEDVSGITKGWEVNPVPYDTIFNESSSCFAFGAPSAMRVFKVLPKLYYDHYMSEDFGANPSSMDQWTLDRFKRLFQDAEKDDNLKRRLTAPGTVFFLHFDAPDVIGGHFVSGAEHPDYYRVINEIDALARQVEQVTNDFYHDDATSFVFTADHGIGEAGGHGDGQPACTRTPIVVWGAGIAKPATGDAQRILYPVPEMDKKFEISSFPNSRYDIEQADIAPLQSVLAGIPIPMNNMGVLPLAFLGHSIGWQIEGALANAKQLFMQVERKGLLKSQRTLLFRPFSEAKTCRSLIAQVESALAKYPTAEAPIPAGEVSALLEMISHIQSLAIDGIMYYQTYDWAFLMTVVTLGYVGWMLFAIVFILRYRQDEVDVHLLKYAHGLNTESARHMVHVPLFIFVVYAVILLIEGSPIQYFFYLGYPCYFWRSIISNRHILHGLLEQIRRNRKTLLWTGIGVVVVVEIVVVSLYKREYMTLAVVAFAFFPILRRSSSESGSFRVAWILTFLAASVFCLLPVEFSKETGLVLNTGLLFAVFAIAVRTRVLVEDSRVFIIQGLIFAVSAFNLFFAERSIMKHEGLPTASCIASVGCSVLSFFTPLLSSTNNWYHRAWSVFFGLASPFLLTSISYEFAFYWVVGIVCALWIVKETNDLKSETHLAVDGAPEVREIATFLPLGGRFVILALLAFFGTGNFASLASFKIASAYRFLTELNEYTMGGILMVKTMIPIMLVFFALRCICIRASIDMTRVLLWLLAVGDLVTLHFFFLIRTQGSWLEIGNDMARFVLGNVFVVMATCISLVSLLYFPSECGTPAPPAGLVRP